MDWVLWWQVLGYITIFAVCKFSQNSAILRCMWSLFGLTLCGKLDPKLNCIDPNRLLMGFQKELLYINSNPKITPLLPWTSTYNMPQLSKFILFEITDRWYNITDLYSTILSEDIFWITYILEQRRKFTHNLLFVLALSGFRIVKCRPLGMWYDKS